MTFRNRVVEVFTAPECEDSAATKKWLIDHEVPFIEKGARLYKDFLLAIGHYAGTPVVVVYRPGTDYPAHWQGHKERLLEMNLGARK